MKIKMYNVSDNNNIHLVQCWTEGRSSTAVVEDLGPTATATEV